MAKLRQNVSGAIPSVTPRQEILIMDGIHRRFRIGCQAGRHNIQSSNRNMPAAYANSDVVDRYLKDDLEYGRLVPVHPPLVSEIHLSKLGVIPKKHQPGKWHLIVDLFSPKGACVNDFIDFHHSAPLGKPLWRMRQRMSLRRDKELYWLSRI